LIAGMLLSGYGLNGAGVGPVGLAVLAFPTYAVQKAISLTSPLTIGAFAAAGPFVVFYCK
jgi:hypothetical protein